MGCSASTQSPVYTPEDYEFVKDPVPFPKLGYTMMEDQRFAGYIFKFAFPKADKSHIQKFVNSLPKNLQDPSRRVNEMYGIILYFNSMYPNNKITWTDIEKPFRFTEADLEESKICEARRAEVMKQVPS